MSSNLTIFEQNVLSGISTEEGKELFLRGKARDITKAEKCAWEWDTINGFISNIRPTLEEMYGFKPVSEVIEFMKERQFRRWFPQGRK